MSDCRTGKPVPDSGSAVTAKKFSLGDRVKKRSGSQWSGLVVGVYSTLLTPEGYAVESDQHAGSVQIYPAAALEMVSSIASDTPRTDAEQLDVRNVVFGFPCDGVNYHVVPSDLARQLERELNELKRAARAHLNCYISLAKSGDAGNWNPEAEEHVINLRRALESK